MLYLLEMGRLPIWALGAVVGGWLCAHAYMRIVWHVQVSRVVLGDGRATTTLASPPSGIDI